MLGLCPNSRRGVGGQVERWVVKEKQMTLSPERALAWPSEGGSVHKNPGKWDTPQTLSLRSIRHLVSSYRSLKRSKIFSYFLKHDCLQSLHGKAVFVLLFLFLFFLNLRGEQMLTDEISLADSFVSDA